MKPTIEVPWPTFGREDWHGHSGIVYAEKNGFKVIDCERCGFKHITPIPSAEELESVYKHDYYSREKPLYLQRHQEDLEWWNLVYDERYEVLEQELPSDRRKLLEVGSGPGYFLARGKGRGWDVTGIEPSSQAVAHSRGLGVDVIEGFLTDDTSDELGQFDAIHASEVLEHLPNPRGMLELMCRLLKPGGVVALSVPNDFNPLQFAACQAEDLYQWWVAPPHHINYFNCSSLSRLLKKAGFDVLKEDASFPLELFLLMGERYVGSDEIGRKVHGLRKKLDLRIAKTPVLDGLRKDMKTAFCQNSVGRLAIIFAQKI